MKARIIGTFLVMALSAGCYVLAHGDGPMTYYMDDNSLLSQHLDDNPALASNPIATVVTRQTVETSR
ncbi:conserved exported hypothetical protein [Burkholderia sp. 8Y]|uniref:hypothetical protein n=1 Tax=Burkholderia sp. 8Y TaxID=2653133 RepID=UPI0012F37C5D|nr:hypothetical protein [Burkholderia sp. 8Y]VXC93463.1 conserved exported hypothetical protein [Burkholderia sp. 8Y]